MIASWRDRSERFRVLGAVLLLTLLAGSATLTNQVARGDTQQFDEQVLRSLRRADNPAIPVGPAWLRSAALDITALGSFTVLALVVLAVVGFLVLQGMSRTALFVLAASAGGWVLNQALKEVFQRARPDVVPHLRDVMTLSFPSGHAMISASVYLTLGVLLTRIAERRVTRIFCISMAVLVTGLVGLSRVYLGVHYPSDVLAGWLMGLSWAIICWFVEQAIERRAGMRAEINHA
jgi:undecaprenyl-diphosphatase